MELNTPRKAKVSLADYNYRQDIENRVLMAQFTQQDLEVLEEILFSSLSIPIRKLAKNLGLSEEEVLPSLEKLSQTKLFTLSKDTLVVDKEMRKYYETQLSKFDEDFKPGMEFFQGLLRKVPIHVLPTWYAIPRSSDNIFESLVEKYFLTPHLFQRHLSELQVLDPHLTGLIQTVFHAPELRVSSNLLLEKFSLSREQFEEMILYLEFNGVCCISYAKVGEQWKEMVSPFQEWKEYLLFLKQTYPAAMPDSSKVARTRPYDAAFLQDMAVILTLAKKQPLSLSLSQDNLWVPDPDALQAIFTQCGGFEENSPTALAYIHRVIAKLCLLKLADTGEGRLYALDAANEWLLMPLETKALYVYRHPLNRMLSFDLPAYLCTERNIREAEKSLYRIDHSGWIDLEEFLQGVMVSLSEKSTIKLTRVGKSWKYTLPKYTEEELLLIKATLFEWLFEIGAIATGTNEGRDCFCITPFGHAFFGC